jgi:hypothetical protein
MQFKITIGFVLMIVLSAQGQGMIDGFMRGRGNLTTALSYSTESYDTYYVKDSAVNNPNLGTISTTSVNLFAAFGATKYLDVVIGLPFVSANASQGYWSTQSALQDFSIYLKGRVYEKDFGALGKLSAMAAAGYIMPASNYVPDAPVAIGHRSKNLEGRLLVQYRLPFGLFVMTQGGYIQRGNITIDRGYEVSVPDAWDYVVRVGGSYKIFYADAWLNIQRARSGTNIGAGVPFPTNAVSYQRAGFTLYSSVPPIKNLGVSAGMSFTLSGENIGKATRVSIGIVYNLPVIKDKNN